MLNKTIKMKYKKDHNALLALISHLALAESKSRTIEGLSKHTGIDQSDIERILNEHKGIFVEIPFRGTGKKHSYYTLHMRFASRKGDEDDHKPLIPEYTTTLFNFISESRQSDVIEPPKPI